MKLIINTKIIDIINEQSIYSVEELTEILPKVSYGLVNVEENNDTSLTLSVNENIIEEATSIVLNFVALALTIKEISRNPIQRAINFKKKIWKGGIDYVEEEYIYIFNGWGFKYQFETYEDYEDTMEEFSPYNLNGFTVNIRNLAAFDLEDTSNNYELTADVIMNIGDFCPASDSYVGSGFPKSLKEAIYAVKEQEEERFPHAFIYNTSIGQ